MTWYRKLSPCSCCVHCFILCQEYYFFSHPQHPYFFIPLISVTFYIMRFCGISCQSLECFCVKAVCVWYLVNAVWLHTKNIWMTQEYLWLINFFNRLVCVLKRDNLKILPTRPKKCMRTISRMCSDFPVKWCI